MKQLKDLKADILDNKFNNFYVFYGEDWGLRKHYINGISKQFQRVLLLDDFNSIADNRGTSSLFKTKTLFVLYNCPDFCNLTSEKLRGFMRKIQNDCVIVDLDEPYEKSNLFKEYQDNITYFPRVNDNIGSEFVKSEVNLISKDITKLTYNCLNDYNEILLETDKIKNYSESKNISMQQAYEILLASGQMNVKLEAYNNDEIVNDLLLNNSKRFGYWEEFIKSNYVDEFWYNISRTTNDYLIAYYISKYGKWDGGKYAYDNGLSWYRIKTIRDLALPYDCSTYLYYAYQLSDIDFKVKTGKIQKEDLFNYLLYTIL